MNNSQKGRQYELILLGATGYTGKFTAQHITASLPTDLKWAIAGRNYSKLATLAQELKRKQGDRVQPGTCPPVIFIYRLKGKSAGGTQFNSNMELLKD